MTVLESTPAPDALLEAVDTGVRSLQEAGLEPRFVVVGTEAYASLCQAMAERFGREPGTFEQYQWLTIVVDPYRAAEVTVLPAPGDVAAGVRAERLVQ